MRRILPVAMLGAALAVALPAVAQRSGGGHASGGFHGGYSGFHGGFAGSGGFSAPRSFGQFVGSAPHYSALAPHAIASAPRYGMSAGRLPVYRPAYRPGSLSAYRAPATAARRGWDRRGRDGDRYRRNYASYGYPYVNSWEVVPWDLGYPDYSGSSEDVSAAQPASEAEPESAYDTAAAEPEGGYREEYAPAQAAAPTPTAPEPQLTLIFKDGHTQQVRNYALTSDSLVDMDQAVSGREARIPLASLDLAATEKAAQQAGLDFTPPAS